MVLTKAAMTASIHPNFTVSSCENITYSTWLNERVSLIVVVLALDISSRTRPGREINSKRRVTLSVVTNFTLQWQFALLVTDPGEGILGPWVHFWCTQRAQSWLLAERSELQCSDLVWAFIDQWIWDRCWARNSKTMTMTFYTLQITLFWKLLRVRLCAELPFFACLSRNPFCTFYWYLPWKP